MTVYVICIDPPYLHARHYIGFTDRTVDERLDDHRACNTRGSPLLKAAIEHGSTLHLVHVYDGATRKFERKLKNRKDATRWCPRCGRRQKIPRHEEPT